MNSPDFDRYAEYDTLKLIYWRMFHKHIVDDDFLCDQSIHHIKDGDIPAMKKAIHMLSKKRTDIYRLLF